MMDDASIPFSFVYGGKSSRDLLPAWEHCEEDGAETWRAPDGRLEVSMARTDYPEFDAAEWTLWFRNPSGQPSEILSDIHDGDFVVELPPDPDKTGKVSSPGDRAVTTMNGCIHYCDYAADDGQSASEFALRPRYLRGGRTLSLKTDDCRSSNSVMPIFDVQGGGRGAIVAIGWTGGWKADFSCEPEGIRVRTGLETARFRLEPGERLRTSATLVLRHGPGVDGPNRFRRLLRERISHVATAGAPVPEGILGFELWGGLPSAEMVRRLGVLRREGIRPDVAWVDAGWHGDCGGPGDVMGGIGSSWSDSVGDWDVSPHLHPDRFRDVRAEAEALGARMLLWLEPERATRPSRAYRSGAPWIVRPPERNGLVWLGEHDTRQRLFEIIAGYVRELGLLVYRQDFNYSPDLAFRMLDRPGREGVGEILHVMGLYELWDRLRAAFPGLVIDNTAGGGRRIDLETLRRSIPMWRSDYMCQYVLTPEVLQAHGSNISRYLPFNGCGTKSCDLYTLRSSWSSSWAVCAWNAAFQKEEDVDFGVLRTAMAQWRRIAPYLSRDFHNHGSATSDPAAWAIWQWHDAEKGEGAVVAFRRPASPHDSARIELAGVSPGEGLSVEDLDTGAIWKTSGPALEISLPERRSSAVLVYAAGGGRP